MIIIIIDGNISNSYTLASLDVWIKLIDWFHNSGVKLTCPIFSRLLDRGYIEGEMDIVALMDELDRIRVVVPLFTVDAYTWFILCLGTAKTKLEIH